MNTSRKHQHTEPVPDTLIMEHLELFHSYAFYEIESVHHSQLHDIHNRKTRLHIDPRIDEDIAYEDQQHGK